MKRYLSLFLSACLLLTTLVAIPMYTSAEASGTVGGVTWTLDDSGVLTLSGSGTVSTSPWAEDYSTNIKKVVIGKDIAEFDYISFQYDYPNLTAFEVEDGNAAYSAVNGGLLDASGETFLLFPCGGTGQYFIPNGVKTIDESAFESCEKVTSVIVPAGVTEIADYAFMECSSLANVYLPDSVEALGFWAFYGCGLTAINLPAGLTEISAETFSSCFSLTDVFVPSSIMYIEAGAFDGCNITNVYYACSEDDRMFMTVDDEAIADANETFDATGVPGLVTPEPTPEPTAEPTPTPEPVDDREWETLVTIAPKDFTKISGSGGAGVLGAVKTTATINDTLVKANITGFAGSLTTSLWYASKYSNFAGVEPKLLTENKPAILEDKAYMISRGDVRDGGDWASPKSGMAITPVFAGNELKVGDTIKITAWVYVEEIVNAFGSYDMAKDQTTPVNTRMWVCRPWQSVTDTGYNNGGEVPSMTVNKTTKPGEWTKVSLEYTVTKENQNAVDLQIDNAPVAPNTAYPKTTYFAGAIVQREIEPVVTPSPEPTAKPTPDPESLAKVEIGDISAEDMGTYYNVSVPYTIDKWTDGMSLGVIVYDVTDVIAGEEAPSTTIATITQAPASEEGEVLKFKVAKKDGGDTQGVAFDYGSTMLVKIGSTLMLTPASKTFTFPDAPKFGIYANPECSQVVGESDLRGTVYVKAEDANVTGASLMIGVYDKDNRLVGFSKVDNAAVCAITLPAEFATVKAFLWDADMQPVILNALVAENKTPKQTGGSSRSGGSVPKSEPVQVPSGGGVISE